MKTKNYLFLLAVVLFTSSQVFAQLTILSGPKQASYYQFVDDISRVSNGDVVNQASSGAAYNFSQLVDPKSPIKIAMMQSDYLYYAQMMDSRNNSNKTNSLKVILPLAHEEIHVVTKKASNLNKLQDLDSLIVAIGTKDQGTYATANVIKDRSGITWKSRNIHFVEALQELMMDRINAFMIVGSAPISKLDLNPQAMQEEISLVELNNFKDWAKYYDNDTIYSTDYKWLEKDVPTFAVRNVLIVNEAKLTDADKVAITKMVNDIKNNYDVLKANGHPKWKEIDFDNWSNSDWPKIDF